MVLSDPLRDFADELFSQKDLPNLHSKIIKDSRMKSFTTRSLNIPFPKKDPHNALAMPTYESVAFEFNTSEDIAANFRGEFPAHTYSRTSNPTVEYFETKVRKLTGAHQVLALSSGM